MLNSMFRRMKLRMKDMDTVKKLCLGAEQHAHNIGEEIPGAEHFLLSAFDLPDGTARRVFERVGAIPDKFTAAIKKQYSEALGNIGLDTSKVDLDDNNSNIDVPNRVLFESKPSAQSLMKELVKLRRSDKDTPLLGLHVIEVLSSKELGVVARALKLMGITQSALKNAVKDELKSYKLSA